MITTTICHATYPSRFNTNSGFYEFHYWELGESVVIRSSTPFTPEDVVQVDSIEANVVTVSVVTDLHPTNQYQLVFLNSRIPVADTDEFEFTAYRGCEILLNKSVSKNGNKGYILLACAPADRMSNICARHVERRENFNFFINGRGHGNSE